MNQHYDAALRDAANDVALSPLSRLKRTEVLYAALPAAAGLAQRPKIWVQTHDRHDETI